MTTPMRRLCGRLTLVGLSLAAGLAWADGDKRSRVALTPLYVQECGSCHTAFAPGLLPAASWQRQMDTLRQHYGTDASLDAATTKELATWLATHAAAGRKRGEVPPEDRISKAAWFGREHREVASATWKLAAVGSAANCSACHTRAAEGSYREREIRIPK